MDMSRHAHVRAQQRSIPPFLVDCLMQWGEEEPAKDGACRLRLTKKSLKSMKGFYGSTVYKAIESYRDVYAITLGNKIVTVAFQR